jgi:hypothetical protein
MGLTIEKLEQWRNEKPEHRCYKVEAEPERHRDGFRHNSPIRVWLWDYEICYGTNICSEDELAATDLVALKRAENMRTLERIQNEMKELGGEVA